MLVGLRNEVSPAVDEALTLQGLSASGTATWKIAPTISSFISSLLYVPQLGRVLDAYDVIIEIQHQVSLFTSHTSDLLEILHLRLEFSLCIWPEWNKEEPARG